MNRETAIGNRSHLPAFFVIGVSFMLALMVLWLLLPPIVGSIDQQPAWILAVVAVLLTGSILLLLKAIALVWIVWRKDDGGGDASEYGVTPPVCGGCGYDLRASPYQCPECGRPVDRMDRTIILYLMTLRRRDELDHVPPQPPPSIRWKARGFTYRGS
jgi:hypothetical protein